MKKNIKTFTYLFFKYLFLCIKLNFKFIHEMMKYFFTKYNNAILFVPNISKKIIYFTFFTNYRS
jgi:hypothetical protein